jgi:hypothetical protein
MTVGELRDELDDWPESFEIIFGCHELEFYRLKKRAGDLLQLEFNQTIYKDSETGKWHIDARRSGSTTLPFGINDDEE